MRKPHTSYWAVVTGDMVGSSDLSPGERRFLPDAITAASGSMQKQFESVPYPVGIFRGDSWQFIVRDPVLSLRTGLYFRAMVRSRMQVKSLDTRLGIGIGTISFLPEENLSSGDGPAFRLSGAALDSLDNLNRLGIAFPEAVRSDLTEALRIVLSLMDQICQRWTPRQAASIAGALLHFTQQEIAEHSFQNEISQQAVAQHLRRASWQTLESSLDYFEAILPGIINPFENLLNGEN